jgi:membrane-associated phospholipid phosphatase
MVKKYTSGYSGIAISLVVIIVIVVSIQYLDTGIAVRVMHFLQSFRTLRKATDNIPDILPHIVGICTVIMWAIYFFRAHEKKHDKMMKFLRLSATSLPIAYLLKTFLQFVFGRTNTRLWLIANKHLEFKWFNELGNGSFPSGHMTVFAALGAAVLIYYPKYRVPVICLLILLGIALITTDYHYLSDVIAGAYLGFITTYTLKKVFDKQKNNP